MHQGNRDFLDYLVGEYTEAFTHDACVLEIGARDINGSVRPWFKAARYIGLDKEYGPSVGIVCDFARTIDPLWGRTFDVVVCFSVLEHEPRWHALLDNALRVLKPGGLLFLSFGADGNKHHAPEPWAPVPVDDFLTWCETRVSSVRIVEAFFERVRFNPDCEGCYDAILRKAET